MGTIRTLLAVAVFIGHLHGLFGFFMTGPYASVQGFYIISGFYMSMVLREKYFAKDRPYQLFISNRCLRLYPIYFSALALEIALSMFFFFFTSGKNPTAFGNFVRNAHDAPLLVTIILLFSNVLLIGIDWGFFLGFGPGYRSIHWARDFNTESLTPLDFILIPTAWSLGVEITYYLLVPILLRCSSKILGVILLAGLVLRSWAYVHGFKYDPWIYRVFPLELPLFLCGHFSYVIFTKIRFIKSKLLHPIGWSCWLGVLLLTICFQKVPEYEYAAFFNSNQLVFYAALILGIPFIFLATKNWHFDQVIGELSFPIYILHRVIMEFDGSSLSTEKGKITCIILTVLISFLLVRLVSQPLERFRHGRLRAAAGPAAHHYSGQLVNDMKTASEVATV